MPELWTALEKKLGMLHGPKDGWPEIRKGVYPLKSQVSKPRTCAFGPVRSRIEILTTSKLGGGDPEFRPRQPSRFTYPVLFPRWAESLSRNAQWFPLILWAWLKNW